MIEKSEKIHLIIVEHQTLLRETLTAMLSREEDLKVVGCWTNAEEAMRDCHNLKFDIALVGFKLKGMDGIHFTSMLLEHVPQVKVIVVSSVCEGRIICDAFEAGASGYIHKDSSTQELVRSIKAVNCGEMALSFKLLKRYIDFSLASIPAEQKKLPLNGVEKEVLTLAAVGMSNKEIADKLNLPLSTVKLRIRTVIRQLEARDRTHAVIKALSQGIITIPDGDH
ncbi:MAG: response regulator [Vulcanimicrobiota bacterium]